MYVPSALWIARNWTDYSSMVNYHTMVDVWVFYTAVDIDIASPKFINIDIEP